MSLFPIYMTIIDSKEGVMVVCSLPLVVVVFFSSVRQETGPKGIHLFLKAGDFSEEGLFLKLADLKNSSVQTLEG